MYAHIDPSSSEFDKICRDGILPSDYQESYFELAPRPTLIGGGSAAIFIEQAIRCNGAVIADAGPLRDPTDSRAWFNTTPVPILDPAVAKRLRTQANHGALANTREQHIEAANTNARWNSLARYDDIVEALTQIATDQPVTIARFADMTKFFWVNGPAEIDTLECGFYKIPTETIIVATAHPRNNNHIRIAHYSHLPSNT